MPAAKKDAVFALRIISCDYFQAPVRPGVDEEDGEFGRITRAPIVRLYGSTPLGQKACVFLHRLYPYLLVNYSHPIDELEAFKTQLGHSINVCMNALQQSPRPQTHVRAIVPVKAIPFYGFHSGYSYFLKIYVVNPGLVTPMVEILEKGAVMNEKFLVYEAHIRFIQQLFIDYNLFGNVFLLLSDARFREPLPDVDTHPASAPSSPNPLLPNIFYTNATTERKLVWPTSADVPKLTFCELEVDAWPMDILNRATLQERPTQALVDLQNGSTPLITQLVPSLGVLWEDEMRRRHAAGLQTQIQTPASQKGARDPQIPWKKRMDGDLAKLDRLLEERSVQPDRNFPVFNEKDGIKTLFMSVSALYDSKAVSSNSIRVNVTQHVVDTSVVDELLASRDRKSQVTSKAASQQTPKGEIGSSSQAEMASILESLRNLEESEVQPDDDEVVDSRLDEDEEEEEILDNAPDVLSESDDDQELSSEADYSSAVEEINNEEVMHESDADQTGTSDVEEDEGEKSHDDDDGGISAAKSPEGVKPPPISRQNATGLRFPLSSTSPFKTRLDTSKFTSPPRSIPIDGPVFGQKTSLSSPVRRPQVVPPPILDREDEIVEDFEEEEEVVDHSERYNDNLEATDDIVEEDDEEMTSPSASNRIPQYDGANDDDEEIARTLSTKKRRHEDSDQPRDQPPAPAVLSSALIARTIFDSRPPAPTIFNSTSIDQLWSPTKPAPEQKWSFYHSPPSVTSPSRHGVYRLNEAPTAEEAISTMKAFGLQAQLHQIPYYSNPKDVPQHALEYANTRRVLKSNQVSDLPKFNPRIGFDETPAPISRIEYYKNAVGGGTLREFRNVWGPAKPPPSYVEAANWIHMHSNGTVEQLLEHENAVLDSGAPLPALMREKEDDDPVSTTTRGAPSQIDGPTPANKYGFKFNTSKSDSIKREREYLRVISLEVFGSCLLTATSRGDLLPDPKQDPIVAIFYCLYSEDDHRYVTNGHKEGYHVGIITVKDEHPLYKTAISDCNIMQVDNERAIIEGLIKLVRDFDPDILSGHEIHNASWGYVTDRAAVFEIDLLPQLSRLIKDSATPRNPSKKTEWAFRQNSIAEASGRMFLNVWRLMRGEFNLTSYSLPTLVFHVLHSRIPVFKTRTLTQWWQGTATWKGGRLPVMLTRWRTVDYFLNRVQYPLEILEATDFIRRTSEYARIFGMPFYSVLTRGSQFRVEAIMSRITRPENLILLSPSYEQVRQQRALECTPLVMEPRSGFYPDPLLVLDFQSLYPSVMIAYNYCYSTCIGRVPCIGKKERLGVLDKFEVPLETVAALREHLIAERYLTGCAYNSPSVAPNGLVFVKAHIRQSVLARMLTEILDTRVMVKAAMKTYKDNKDLLKTLESRQLALKLIANVTYGYTGASATGRMPCAEIADAIVQTGRDTLERCISKINGSPQRWGAKVQYGDTDSLFVVLEGCLRSKAFDIAKDIVTAMTDENPHPVKLKFEKVYHPCFLYAKKKYVGASFENPEQEDFIFDAKGIETVRRDQFPAVAKILERALKIMFRTADLSAVKEFIINQIVKLESGKVSLIDFLISSEVRLGSYRAKTLPAGAELAKRELQLDPRAQPQFAERKPFVLAAAADKKTAIATLSVAPELAAANLGFQLNKSKYQEKIRKPIERLFNLVGADVKAWFREVPKVDRAIVYVCESTNFNRKNNTIDGYYTSNSCPVCHRATKKAGSICEECRSKPAQTNASVMHRLSASEIKHTDIMRICRDCSGFANSLDSDIPCWSVECPIMYERVKVRKVVESNQHLQLKWQECLKNLEW
ncbi:DNA-directed DNA polymerase [Synchytrium microbalum]|uniref:DNA polymerase n=1 Tax=Synchytrium microbalum TaxID=1806994 RepID=A0A507C0U6_9FUNG|nr:DNA-directed DNA polymerase [Synchytrium microbalum]TPX33312.1 DNA-directed DNA polymerase [Synchytrium microbalum]